MIQKGIQAILVGLLIGAGTLTLGQSALAAPLQQSTIYLPAIYNSPSLGFMVFGSALSCTDEINNLTPAPATFSSGIRRLAFETTVFNGINVLYRLEWTVNGKREPDLDASGQLTKNPQNVGTTIFFGPKICRDLLPAGIYQVTILLNNVSYATAIANIGK